MHEEHVCPSRCEQKGVAHVYLPICPTAHSQEYTNKICVMGNRLLRILPSSVSSPPCTESCLPDQWIEGISS